MTSRTYSSSNKYENVKVGKDGASPLVLMPKDSFDVSIDKDLVSCHIEINRPGNQMT